MSPTQQKFPLSRKKIFKKTFSAMEAWIVFSIIVYGVVIFLAFSVPQVKPFLGIVTFVILAVLLVLTILNYLYQSWYFKTYFYDLTPDHIVIRKGPITPREITIPYERVQDVYVDQDFMDRILGLYDVHLSSATASSGMEAHIDGVEKVAADGLKGTLLSTVSTKIKKA